MSGNILPVSVNAEFVAVLLNGRYVPTKILYVLVAKPGKSILIVLFAAVTYFLHSF